MTERLAAEVDAVRGYVGVARHMYYSSFDWLSPEQLEQLLPEDGVP